MLESREVVLKSKTPGTEMRFNEYGENCLELNIKVSDPSAIAQIENGILSYLNGNEFLQKNGKKKADGKCKFLHDFNFSFHYK